MAEKISDFAHNILNGLKEAVDYVEGRPNECRTTTYVFADAKAIRKNLGLSQSEFSMLYRIPLNTLQNWEQKRTYPDHTASAYLWAIEALPWQIREAQIHHRNSNQAFTSMT